jgi:formyl transferase-like protein
VEWHHVPLEFEAGHKAHHRDQKGASIIRILLLATAFNSLTQRVYVELTDLGHDLAVSLVPDGDDVAAAVEDFLPDVIIAPYLKCAIPESIWRPYTCLIVHPGIRADRGPPPLDWAILRGERRWGVTVLQAAAEFDAGDIWALSRVPDAPCVQERLISPRGGRRRGRGHP